MSIVSNFRLNSINYFIVRRNLSKIQIPSTNKVIFDWLQIIQSKFKKIVDKAEDFLLGNSSKKATSKEVNFFGDSFKKKTSNEHNYQYQVSKTVWVNGQAFNVVGNNEEEVKAKVSKLNQNTEVKSETLVDSTKYIFSNLYTQHKEAQVNEWSLKRDVWINEYCPA